MYYVRDFDGAKQRLKAMVPDQRVWLLTPPCVIVAVHWSKALKDAHRGQAIFASVRPTSTEDCTSGIKYALKIR